MHRLPNFEELRAYIAPHPNATIREICKHFNQCGDVAVAIRKPGCPGKQLVLANGISPEFWEHLREFMKKPYVRVGGNLAACAIADDIHPVYPGAEVVPIVLTIV
jgi:hypothetical protein